MEFTCREGLLARWADEQGLQGVWLSNDFCFFLSECLSPNRGWSHTFAMRCFPHCCFRLTLDSFKPEATAGNLVRKGAESIGFPGRVDKWTELAVINHLLSLYITTKLSAFPGEPVWTSGKGLGWSAEGPRCDPLRLSFLFKIVVYGHCLCDFTHTINETLKWLAQLPTLMQSFWWWQCSE